MTKSWTKSQTITSALLLYAVTAAPIAYDSYSDRRMPNREELAVLLGGFYALEKTISGRLKAQEDIGKPTPTAQPMPEVVATVPDFSEVEALPGPDDVDPPPAEQPDSTEEDPLPVDLDELKGSYRLVAKQSTALKTDTAQGAELNQSQKLPIAAGKELRVDSWCFCNPPNGHLMVEIDEHPDQQFFVFANHWTLFNDLGKAVNLEPVVTQPATPKPVVSKDRGKAFKLPGYDSTFYMKDYIGGTHFTWAEMTRSGERMPESKPMVDNGIAAAKMLEAFRKYIGNKPLVVTSWYRPLRINRAIGSGDGSQHVQNRAVDFYCPSMSVWDLQGKAKVFAQQHGYAIGLGAKKGFVHLDCRGYFVSWDY